LCTQLRYGVAQVAEGIANDIVGTALDKQLIHQELCASAVHTTPISKAKPMISLIGTAAI
jgi:hypothetical protein